MNRKVSYCKQVTRQHLCHKKFVVLGLCTLEWRARLTRRNIHLVCYIAKCGHSRSGSKSIIHYGDLPGKFDPSCPAFQGHSRPLEPTRIDQLPTTSCQWSKVIMGLSHAILWDKLRFQWKIVNFLPHVYSTPPLREFPFEFCNNSSSHAPTRQWKDFDDMCIRLDTILQYDGWTDWWTGLWKQCCAVHA